jgi:hypothetical protein
MAKNGNIHPSRIFKSPDELQKAWEGYKSSLKERAKQWPKVQYVGKEGNKETDYPKLPFTMDGFEVYCYDNHGMVGQYFDNKDGLYADFVTITTRIRREIRDDQITGAMVGDYNSNITARLNGLKEQSEQTIKQEPRVFNVD